jgi:site-specific recombinase XerD
MNDVQGFGPLATAYLEALRVRNYSERTVESREHHLREFVKWCAARSLSRPAEITKPTLERYQRWLYHYRKKDGQPLSFRSQHGCLVPVRALFKWLCRQNLLLANPAADLELPRAEKRLPRHVLTAAEAERVLALPDVAEPLGLRDRAILEAFYSTGMRRMELLGLKLYDLDQERGTVFIRQGKGKKDRMIPMGERAFAWVRRYLEEARPSLALTPDDGDRFPDERRPVVRAEPADAARARLRRRGRDRQDRVLPSLPPHVRDADAGGRRGHPVHPAVARAREAGDDADLRPGQHPDAEGSPHQDAPGQADARRGHGRAGGRTGRGSRRNRPGVGEPPPGARGPLNAKETLAASSLAAKIGAR